MYETKNDDLFQHGKSQGHSQHVIHRTKTQGALSQQNGEHVSVKLTFFSVKLGSHLKLDRCRNTYLENIFLSTYFRPFSAYF